MQATSHSSLPNVIQSMLNGAVAEQFHGRMTLPPLQLIIRPDTMRTDPPLLGADRDVVASSNDADTDEYGIFIWSPFKLFVDSVEVFSTDEDYDRYTWIPHPVGRDVQLPALVALVGKKVLDVHLDGEWITIEFSNDTELCVYCGISEQCPEDLAEFDEMNDEVGYVDFSHRTTRERCRFACGRLEMIPF